MDKYKATPTAGIEGREKDTKVEPSGPRGDNPATAGSGPTGIRSATPENAAGHIDPSAPGNTGTTPDSNSKH